MHREAPGLHAVRFGVFELDTRTGELRKHGIKIPLRDQSVRILEMLLDRPGELVTRQEIKQSLWANDTFVEFDHSINAAVTRLRQALGDPAENPRFIETVAGRGYRFITPLDSTPSRRPSRKWAGVIFSAALLIIGGLAAWFWHGKISGRNLESRRLVVAVFENRTGDPGLDQLGRIAADWIGDGLSQIGTFAVAPSSTVLDLANASSQLKSAMNQVNSLAAATGASLVVTGEYYKQDGNLQVGARITDVATGTVLHVVEAAGPLDEPMKIMETVRRRIVNAVAARYLNQEFDFLSHESRPPAFEAYRIFLTALEVFYTDNAAAIPYLERALALDPDFTAPRVWLVGAYSNAGNYVQASKQLAILDGRRSQLTPVNRRRLDFFRANLDGRNEDALLAQRDVAKLAPGSPVERFVEAGWAISSNHLREAVEALQAPVRWDLMVKPAAPFGSIYFLELTAALHELGDHPRELNEARRGRAVYPSLMNIRAFEARALVALGKFDEMEKVIEQTLAMPTGGQGCSSGEVMNIAATELRAHGQREASLTMAWRAAEWYRARTKTGACSGDSYAFSLYSGERWEDAGKIFSELAARYPDRVSYRGALGALAAHQGDRAAAQRIATELLEIDRDYLFGEPSYQRARIATLLGDKGGAVTMLRQAIAEGFSQDPNGFRFILRHELDLESLRGRSPFEELVKPKE